MLRFKNAYSDEYRKFESKRVLTKFPDRKPVICEVSSNARNDCPLIDKKKYLVPDYLTFGQFMYVIRKRLKISSEKALFLFVDNRLPPSTIPMCDLYHMCKDEDGFLYVTYSFENTFG
jgi:GABA(A) receptor-associated protein